MGTQERRLTFPKVNKINNSHESSTRTVDEIVWDEIRNFKKCLVMMFAKQGKDVLFLETVTGLAQQRRHCMVECIPLPREVSKQAPAYFKKEIDEAEDEWSQHNAKKLIDTSQKGLQASIPENFSYFYVEFGLNKGFVHVIDDEKEFRSSFGIDVVRGRLGLPVENKHQTKARIRGVPKFRKRLGTIRLDQAVGLAFYKKWFVLTSLFPCILIVEFSFQ